MNCPLERVPILVSSYDVCRYRSIDKCNNIEHTHNNHMICYVSIVASCYVSFHAMHRAMLTLCSVLSKLIPCYFMLCMNCNSML